jgi:glycosyltransferase involved in cell wall biosynthesis
LVRISLVNVNFIAEDAIGQCLLNQIRFFRRRGDDVQIYAMHPPRGVPEDIEALTRVVSLADLIERRHKHFAHSDLYVYHYPSRYPLMETIKGLDRGAVIFYYHNVTPAELWQSPSEREFLRHSRQSVGSLVHYADLVVTSSPFNAKRLVERFGSDHDRVEVLPMAVSLNDFSPGPPDLSLVQQYGLEGRRIILFVGRMAANKRIDLLVEALPRVQREVADTMLMLVGDAGGNPAIQETVARARSRADELGVTEDVVFTGIVEKLPPYYRLADVYATASLHEGFGVPLIEAMASGLPIVASRATAHPWVVGEAGLLAEPGDPDDLADKILRVLNDDGLCGSLVRRGLARARKFSLEHYEAEWRRIVSEVTAWLPDQPYPRPRSLTAQPVDTDSGVEGETQASMLQEVLLNGELGQLEAAADVMIKDYKVRSRVPVVGGLIAWLRRNLTSHLRGPYIDPTFRRQVAFNNQLVEWMTRALKFWATSDQQRAELEDRIETLEAQVDALTRRLDEEGSP